MSTDNPAYRQIGWRSRLTGEICDCPAYERSPHAFCDPVYVEEVAPGWIDDGDGYWRRSDKP